MIRRIGFSNFYSFKDYQEIVFTTHKKDSYDYYTSKGGEQITKVLGISGGNASGKTNIMRVFGFIKYFLFNTAREDGSVEEEILFKTFFNNKEESHLDIEFEVNNKTFYYDLTIKENRVLKEKLAVRVQELGERRSTVFLRSKKAELSLNPKFFKKVDPKFFVNIRSDISIIPYIKGTYDVAVVNEVYEFFYNMTSNINEQGIVMMNEVGALKMFLEQEDIKKEVIEVIRNFDLGLERFDVKQDTVIMEDDRKMNRYQVEAWHNTENGIKTLPFMYESSGSRQLIFILAMVLNALRTGGVVVIDEIEMGLHPTAVEKIIQYFIDENEEGHSQMIFASHHLSYLNRFDMQQIYLVDKKEDGESFAYRLDQVEGIRHDANFLSKYLTGSYGAYPDITI